MDAAQTHELTGPAATLVGSLTNLAGLSLESNSLVGQIPDSFASLSKLTGLYVPPLRCAVGRLRCSETMRRRFLSSNQLTGSLPSWLGARAVRGSAGECEGVRESGGVRWRAPYLFHFLSSVP